MSHVPAIQTVPATGAAARSAPVLCALCALLLLFTSSACAAGQAHSGLNSLAIAVSREAEPVRADFARAAISEMTAAHAAEAQLARREARSGGRRRELARWAAAVESYAAELAAIGDALTATTPVDIHIGADGSVYLNIAGQPVLVGAPRALEQRAFERRIIERFCAGYRCETFVADLGPVAAPPVARHARPPIWSFSQYAGPACSTEEGLELQFRDTQDLARKRVVCAQLVAELNLLLGELDAQIDKGVRLDWNRLAVAADPATGSQQITLNAPGDTVAALVPGLATVPGFLRRALPWVAARTRGESYRLVILNAEDLLAPLLYSADPAGPLSRSR